MFARQYNMCWDQTKSPSGTCPKAEMGKCRWNHMPLVTITVALECAPTMQTR